MNDLALPRHDIRRGIELGFFRGQPVIYDGTEPVAIDAQAGKGKLTRFLGVNLVSPRTMHLSKIVTDPKDGELAWVSWKTLEREGYWVRFINPGGLYGYPSETFNFNTRLLEVAARPELRGLVGEAAYDAASFLVPIDPHAAHRWIGQGVRTMFALYYKTTALFPSVQWPCTPGGLWDFFGRSREEIAEELYVWACDGRKQDDAGMAKLIASMAASKQVHLSCSARNRGAHPCPPKDSRTGALKAPRILTSRGPIFGPIETCLLSACVWHGFDGAGDQGDARSGVGASRSASWRGGDA